MSRNEWFEETYLRTVVSRIEDALPKSWKVELLTGYVVRKGLELDAILSLVPPNAERVDFAVEIKQSGRVPTELLSRQLFRMRSAGFRRILFVTDFIGPTLRRHLEDLCVNFADTTGWLRITSDEPPILLSTTGASRAPRDRSTSAVTRMNGRAAGRIISALAGAELPIGVRGLAELAGVNPGSVSKLLQTLDRESVISRNGSGVVNDVDRWEMVERWVEDYSFTKTNKNLRYFIAPRGIKHALDHIDEGSTPVVLTGSAAARRLLPEGTVPVVAMHQLVAYTADPMLLARSLDLVETQPAIADVILATPNDPELLSTASDGTEVAPPAVVIADLLTLPNRSDAEARQLAKTFGDRSSPWKVPLAHTCG